jgi:hypothetical protein
MHHRGTEVTERRRKKERLANNLVDRNLYPYLLKYFSP